MNDTTVPYGKGLRLAMFATDTTAATDRTPTPDSDRTPDRGELREPATVG